MKGVLGEANEFIGHEKVSIFETGTLATKRGFLFR